MRFKKAKNIGIKNILFASYMNSMLLTLLVVTVFFAVFEFSTLNTNIQSGIKQTNKSVAQSIDNQIKQMDTVSISALYSNLLKDFFSTYSNYLNTQTSFASNNRLNNAKMLHDLMFAIIGVNSDIRQINLYNLDYGGFGTGMYNGYINYSVKDMHWFENAYKAEGKRYVTPPYKEENLYLNKSMNSDRYLISLCRIYFDSYNKPDGVIQVTEYYTTVFKEALYNESIYKPTFYVYDEKGVMLFPTQKGAFDYFGAKNDNNSVIPINNSVTGNYEFVFYETSPYTNFTTVAVVNSINFYAPILQFMIIVLLLFFGIVFVCNITARKLANRLASPLVFMYSYLTHLDFEHLTWKNIDLQSTHVIEIDELAKSINLFQQKLKGSMEDILMLQRQEAQSQMLALQSQMNPHFLYNSLSTIQAMAEEGSTKDVSEMCTAITDILRYISSFKESMVTLEEELEITDLYFSCLTFRYEDDLNFNIEVDDSMLNILVPKLCIQLLVENAVKFTTRSIAPPWEILVSCVISQDQWIVTVYDNGSGFSDDSIKTIQNKIKKIEETNLLPSLELQGMGLMNLYIRLKLIYKKDYLMEFGNRKNGGAFVRIKGGIHA